MCLSLQMELRGKLQQNTLDHFYFGKSKKLTNRIYENKGAFLLEKYGITKINI